MPSLLCIIHQLPYCAWNKAHPIPPAMFTYPIGYFYQLPSSNNTVLSKRQRNIKFFTIDLRDELMSSARISGSRKLYVKQAFIKGCRIPLSIHPKVKE